MSKNWEPCVCGHSIKNHISRRGLCLVRSCKGIYADGMCLGYRPAVKS